MSEKILNEILQELKGIHDHLNIIETLYKYVNRVEMKKFEKSK